MRVAPVAGWKAGDAFLRIYRSLRRSYADFGRLCALEPSLPLGALCGPPTSFPIVTNGGRARCRPECRPAGRRGPLPNSSTGEQEIRT